MRIDTCASPSVTSWGSTRRVWFIDLAPTREPAQVIDAIAGPLGVGQLADRPREELVAMGSRWRSSWPLPACAVSG